MARTSGTANNKARAHGPKKTSQGKSVFSKVGSKGGGVGGSTPSKKYRKKYRGQGRK
jgi:hypothetical protein